MRRSRFDSGFSGRPGAAKSSEGPWRAAGESALGAAMLDEAEATDDGMPAQGSSADMDSGTAVGPGLVRSESSRDCDCAWATF